MALLSGFAPFEHWVIAAAVTPARPITDEDTKHEAEYTAFFRRVWRVAMLTTQSMVGQDDASDIASQVTLRLWRHRDRYPELATSPAALERFAVAAARRQMLNQERNRRLRSVREQSYVAARTDGVATDDASSRLHTSEMLALVAQVIDGLPDRTREAWRLVHVNGMSHADAARAMGIAKQTVNVQLCRALKSLRMAFDRYQRDGLLPSVHPVSRSPFPSASSMEQGS